MAICGGELCSGTWKTKTHVFRGTWMAIGRTVELELG